MSKHSKTGFTLVELLVVIGVIGFLLALIIPAMGRAKDHSRLIICRSNQKSLVLGCLAYASENGSSLPVDKWMHNSHTLLIDSLASGGHIDGPKAYYCPSEKKEDLKYSEDNFNKGDIGYFYYIYDNRPTLGILSSFFLKHLPAPRKLQDTMSHNKWVFSDSWFSGAPTSHRWYKKGVNYATIDGSVHMVKQSPKREFN